MGLGAASATEPARQEVREWLRSTLPSRWIALVDDGRSPGSPSLYPHFDLDEWVHLLFSTRYVMSDWPPEYGGLGASPDCSLAIHEELARHEAPLPLWVSPLLMCGQALLACGTEAQRTEFLPKMASGEEIWCQLFSEPEAGSDLASLRTRAVRDGVDWFVTGQKVWTTYAHRAVWGMLLARTDEHAPRHRGITAMIVDMRARGIDVRPLRQMTGEASFNEVFLDNVVVPDARRVGPINGGWGVTVAMLQTERGILSSQRVGGIDVFQLLDRHRGTAGAVARQRLMIAYSRYRVLRMMAWRGYGDGVEAQVTKLMQTESNRAMQELALDLEGLIAVAHPEGEVVPGEIRYGFLRSRANTIAGGTSEIMRNIIGERILGLPREPIRALPREPM